MKMKIELDLTDIYPSEESIATAIGYAVQAAVVSEARKTIKEWMQSKEVKAAIQAAKNSIDMKELEKEAKTALINVKKKHFQKELDRLERMR